MSVAEFDPLSYFRNLKDASIRLQRATLHSAERNVAIDEVFELIRQAKKRVRYMMGSEKRTFIAKVELISGLKIQDDTEDNDTETPVTRRVASPKAGDLDLSMPDLSGRLPRYVASAKPGDPEMRVIQMAVKKQDDVTMILVIGEANQAFYVTRGVIGGEYQTWDTPHIGVARRQFSILRDEGYREVSPADIRHHRSTFTATTANFPNRRRLGRNQTSSRRRKSDIAT